MQFQEQENVDGIIQNEGELPVYRLLGRQEQEDEVTFCIYEDIII